MTRSKYNVSSDKSRRTYNGIAFDSQLEMRYYRDVVVPGLESGEIISADLQKKYILQPSFEQNGEKYREITYIADFVLVFQDGHEEVIDIKGNVDNVFAIKKKMLLFHYPDMNFRTIGYSKMDGGWVDRDYILQQRKIRKKEKQDHDSK